MRVLIVHNREISDFPPVRSLVDALIANKVKTTIITRDENNVLDSYGDKLKVLELLPYASNGNFKNTYKFFENRKLIRKWVKKEMKNNDIIWTTTDATVREIGPDLLNYKHVMQLMELVEYVPKFPLIPKKNLFKFNRYGGILKKLLKFYPNKPYKINFENKDDDTSRISDIIETMRSDQRLKILYQGVFDKDRKLDEFAKTIENESDKFCLYIMGKQNKYSKELCKKYPHIRYIPYITSPNHLKITREADIGLLPYFPVRVGNNSILNALYCAPNKIYEYSAFGKPMLGTDVLGLKYPFEKYKMGYTVSKLEEKEILEKLNKILVNYQKMSENSRRFFQSVNWDKKIDEILEIKEEEKD